MKQYHFDKKNFKSNLEDLLNILNFWNGNTDDSCHLILCHKQTTTKAALKTSISNRQQQHYLFGKTTGPKNTVFDII